MKYLVQNRTAYNEMMRWKRLGPSDRFKALIDLNNVHSECRYCIWLADRVLQAGKDAHDGIAHEHRDVPRTGEHFLVRERNCYWFRVVRPAQRTVASLHAAILTTYRGYTPMFARDPTVRENR